MLETLARLEDSGAHAALKRIVLSPGLPASLLPVALQSAARAGLVLPAAFVAGFLDHDDPGVRTAAFDLASGAGVPASRLREGLSDREPSIRRGAAMALARRGDASGRDMLTAELAAAPSDGIVEALGAIGDDEAIVALGRCALRHPDVAPVVIAVLRDLGSRAPTGSPPAWKRTPHGRTWGRRRDSSCRRRGRERQRGRQGGARGRGHPQARWQAAASGRLRPRVMTKAGRATGGRGRAARHRGFIGPPLMARAIACPTRSAAASMSRSAR